MSTTAAMRSGKWEMRCDAHLRLCGTEVIFPIAVNVTGETVEEVTANFHSEIMKATLSAKKEVK